MINPRTIHRQKVQVLGPILHVALGHSYHSKFPTCIATFNGVWRALSTMHLMLFLHLYSSLSVVINDVLTQETVQVAKPNANCVSWSLRGWLPWVLTKSTHTADRPTQTTSQISCKTVNWSIFLFFVQRCSIVCKLLLMCRIMREMCNWNDPKISMITLQVDEFFSWQKTGVESCHQSQSKFNFLLFHIYCSSPPNAFNLSLTIPRINCLHSPFPRQYN